MYLPLKSLHDLYTPDQLVQIIIVTHVIAMKIGMPAFSEKKEKRKKKKSPFDVHGADLEQRRGFKWRLKLQFSSHTISPCDNSEIAAGNNTMLQLKENPLFFFLFKKEAS